MRRIIIIGTTAVALVGAAVALASGYNTYTANFKFTPPASGSAKHPSPLTTVETLTAKAPAGKRAAPLYDILTKVYGGKYDAKDFAVCTDKTIEKNAHNASKPYDKSCPNGSEIASGPVNALLGPESSNLATTGTPCNPFLHIYNGGTKKVGGKTVGVQVFFFTTDATHTCGSLVTGQTAPYDGTVSMSGKWLVTNVPLPPDVSTKVAGQKGLYGSLIKETVTYKKLTKKVHGKTVAYESSVACKNGKRPFSVKFSAQDYPAPQGDGKKASSTVTGSTSC